MNMFKISNKMFDTFGIEDFIIQKYKDFLINNISENVNIGCYSTEDFLKDVFQKYGYPKREFQKSICLLIERGNEESGTFRYDEDNLYIIKKTKDFKNIKINEYFKSTISHEIQHLLRNIYSGPLNKHPKTGTIEYYSLDSEIQAFSYSIAKNSFETIKMAYGEAIKFKNKEKIKENMDNLFKRIILMDLSKFFNLIEIKNNKELSQQTKNKYYKSTYRDFNYLIEKWIEEK